MGLARNLSRAAASCIVVATVFPLVAQMTADSRWTASAIASEDRRKEKAFIKARASTPRRCLLVVCVPYVRCPTCRSLAQCPRALDNLQMRDEMALEGGSQKAHHH